MSSKGNKLIIKEIWVDGRNNTWVNAEDLEVGMTITSRKGEELIEIGVVTATERLEVPQVMYNLTVEEANTFFVGKGQWLVHNSSPCPSLRIDDAQFGKKVGKHATDYGLNPSDPAARDFMRNHIEDIATNYHQLKRGPWNPKGSGGNEYLFFRKGADVVVSKSDGTFVTILKDGQNNGWFNNASDITDLITRGQ